MRLVAVLYWCLGAAAKHVLIDHTINAGPIGLDLDGQLKVVGFGKRGAYHPLAVAGVKIGDVIVQVDGEAQPPGGLARPRTLPRRYREARARLNEDWPQRRRIRFRREVGQETAAPAPEPAADAGPTAAAGPMAPSVGNSRWCVPPGLSYGRPRNSLKTATSHLTSPASLLILRTSSTPSFVPTTISLDSGSLVKKMPLCQRIAAFSRRSPGSIQQIVSPGSQSSES